MVPTKRNNKRKLNRRRRAPKRKAGVKPKGQMVMYNRISDKPMRFIKTVYGGQVVAGPNGPILGTLPFTIGNVSDFTNIALLFNRYKLNKVTCTFTLRSTVASAGGLDSSTQLPKIFCRYNYDSNATSANVGQRMQELSNVKTMVFTAEKNVFTYTLIPRTVAPVYLSSVATGYELQKRTYIDSAYPTVPHYGVQFWLPYVASTEELIIDFTYDFTCKYQM